MGMPSGQELLVILAIVVLLFGAKKIPELAKGIGKGIKNFKAEMKNEDNDEDIKTAQSDTTKKVESSETTASSETPKTTTQA
ncbi:MAG: preprotein translocase subunit TatA [Sulfurimonas sp. RIFOXYD12_FULL_33_39]|uniref:Sec-independent protein translocase subunit TatA/TatB n=1 Tax=unclassified Sulfurimonas TaxID=2623549 RepID=UPI0008CFABD3|nr:MULTISPECIES: twin-arginine translocase TatA/TatE family subunit [unclassified Sulfurimonas]OHE07761.1 MAG: preprotein translocase subunit TatA [Sulfurimonas sp. RIFCSPLOWO2_12_FULL_34_6]OHE09684.1 MAG: preprotein translocase subunit TatA [Sulfurimonas sp. RIFOXYD12_FULL_33_39]OHE13808.1 MAG: preprotein translocase subunit TatA [Sulfurimonas sp. RIFOXYD2_FULL_34_21]DAB27880.1 MAG TPA: twin-arginine translocase TatA/TatE family subunit [Sulfurimonas sp. UBA10385]